MGYTGWDPGTQKGHQEKTAVNDNILVHVNCEKKMYHANVRC